MANRRLGDWLTEFLRFTDNTEPPESFRKWTGISAIAAVLQRKCWVKWGRVIWYPNLYIILVGPPAARKGTAMAEGKELLDQLGISIAADEGSRQKLISALEDTSMAEQGPDGKLHHHASLTIFSTELTVFLGYENHELLAMLCKWFDCENRYVYDTFRGGRQEIPNVWANLIGGTTPTQLQSSLPESAFGSGFTSRVIFVFEEDKGKVVILPSITSEEIQLQQDLIHDLGEIKNIHGEFLTTPEFKDLYTDWRMGWESKRVFPNEAKLDYYVERRPTHLFKLSMVHSVSRSDDRVITVDDLAAAIDTLESVERNMPLVFQGIGDSPFAAAQARMTSILRDRKTMRMGELFRVFANDLSPAQFSEVIKGLVMMGFCKQDIINQTITVIGEKK